MKYRISAFILIVLSILIRSGIANAHASNPMLFDDDAIASAMRSYFQVRIDTPARDSTIAYDSAQDSVVFDFGTSGFTRRRHTRTYVFTELGRSRQVPYNENFTWIDFNRVTGFFLGAGTSGLEDLGPHDEFGLDANGGYGFADKRWEYRFGAEFRLPLAKIRNAQEDSATIADDTVRHKWKHEYGREPFYIPPTLAFGGEVHNITSTDDAWRAGKLENAAYAFFAREDFRDYYKLAGWDAYLAFRPMSGHEFRIEWRSDHYQSLPQEVYHGRWGGNKVLPPNPPVAEGTMHSLVITSQHEKVHTRYYETTSMFGDSVSIEQLAGTSGLAQVELGHMPATDFGFNRFLLDLRRFQPILKGLSFDSRFRFEATTGDPIFQKLEFLGGPGSLPALYRKSLIGNRMLLLNTEIRLSLGILTSALRAPDFDLVIYNDFGKIGMAANGESILQGYGFSGASSILYNVGIGLGWTNGIQVGVTWPTNVKDDPRLIFRLQRPF
jgi:hypothetical protein